MYIKTNQTEEDETCCTLLDQIKCSNHSVVTKNK